MDTKRILRAIMIGGCFNFATCAYLTWRYPW